MLHSLHMAMERSGNAQWWRLKDGRAARVGQKALAVEEPVEVAPVLVVTAVQDLDVFELAAVWAGMIDHHIYERGDEKEASQIM